MRNCNRQYPENLQPRDPTIRASAAVSPRARPPVSQQLGAKRETERRTGKKRTTKTEEKAGKEEDKERGKTRRIHEDDYEKMGDK